MHFLNQFVGKFSAALFGQRQRAYERNVCNSGNFVRHCRQRRICRIFTKKAELPFAPIAQLDERKCRIARFIARDTQIIELLRPCKIFQKTAYQIIADAAAKPARRTQLFQPAGDIKRCAAGITFVTNHAVFRFSDHIRKNFACTNDHIAYSLLCRREDQTISHFAQCPVGRAVLHT